MADPQQQTRDQRLHRALSSGARARLLSLLRAEPGLDATGLAERLDLHVNTVRAHLGVLEQAGLVAAEVESRDRPGRPRRLYRADETALPGEDGHGALAAVLAGELRDRVPDPAAAGEAAGRAWGARAVADTAGGGEGVDADRATARLVAMLEDMGFAPRLHRDDGSSRVVLRRCPFLQAARAHEDVVCAVHLGLMRGALAELGTEVVVDDLIPWAEPEACVAHLSAPGT